MQGPPTAQAAMIRMYLTPQPSEMSCFSVTMFPNSSIKLGKSSLGEVDILAGRELELGPVEGLNHMVLVLKLSMDGRDDLATVSWGFPKAPCGYCCLEPRLGTVCGQTGMSTGKGCLQGPVGQPEAAFCSLCTPEPPHRKKLALLSLNFRI